MNKDILALFYTRKGVQKSLVTVFFETNPFKKCFLNQLDYKYLVKSWKLETTGVRKSSLILLSHFTKIWKFLTSTSISYLNDVTRCVCEVVISSLTFYNLD